MFPHLSPWLAVVRGRFISSLHSPHAFPTSLLGMTSSNLLFLLIFLFLAVIGVFAMSTGRDPQTAITILQARILAAQIDALALSTLFTSLREVASARAELGGNGRVGRDPICESVFAVLDDAAHVYVLIDVLYGKK